MAEGGPSTIRSPVAASKEDGDKSQIAVGIKPSSFHPTGYVPSRRTHAAGADVQDNVVPDASPFPIKSGGSSTVPGDILTRSPPKLSQRNSDVSSSLMLEQNRIKSIATDMVNKVLRYSLVILTILVVDDCDKYRPDPREPPFDADKSCKILQDSLESFGATVLVVKNKNLELLRAIIDELKSRAVFPDSCQLLWFIFTGHGYKNYFCIKNDKMEFQELISKMSEVKISRQAYFFECCLKGSEGITVKKINQQYMAFYSAPPGEISLHWNGVGMMVLTLVKLLNEKYPMTLNDFQITLRQNLLDELVAKKKILPSQREKFMNKHLPVFTSNMVDNISLYEEVERAMQPTIAVNLPNTSCRATITVQIPQRFTDHQSFDLISLKVIIQTESMGKYLDTKEVNFEDESPLTFNVIIPHQIDQSNGELMVAAQYSNGRIVLSVPYIVHNMPQFVKPANLNFEWKNKDERKGSVAYSLESGSEDSPNSEKERVEIGFLDDDEWVILDHKEGDQSTSDERFQHSITFDESSVRTKRSLQVRVKYRGTVEYVYSEKLEVHQPATPNKCCRTIHTCWNCTPKLMLLLSVIFLVLPIVSISCVATIGYDRTQLVSINQTVLLQPHGFFVWCRGFHISEHIVKFSDYPPGVIVSAYLVDGNALKEIISIGNGTYPGDRSIDYGQQRSLMPTNYYSDPIFFLQDSVINLQSKVFLPKHSSKLSYAIVYVFSSRIEATNFQQGIETSAKNSIDQFDVTNCVNVICNFSHTVRVNSFLFFVLASDATTEFDITTNFTFQVLRFVYPILPSRILSVANISRNTSALVPLHINKPHQMILLYTNTPNTSEVGYRLSHLNISCAARRSIQAPLIVLTFIPLIVFFLVLIALHFRAKMRMHCLRLFQMLRRQQPTLDMHSPLLKPNSNTTNYTST